ncbi:MAG: VWA domain-containing protein [Polyangiaceae bacterium]
MRSALACVFGFGLTLVTLHAVGCSSGPENNRFSNGLGTGGASNVGGTAGVGGTSTEIVGGADAGFNPDASCGFQSFVAKTDPIRLYLVVDRSGSMADEVDGQVKFTALRSALVDLVGEIGFRAEIGMAIYPYQPQGDSCHVGKEMVAMQPGDAHSYYEQGLRGPVTANIYSKLLISPAGGTPTGPTLSALRPTLESLGKNTFVLLATDGGPNCNESATCTAAQCIPNIEGDPACSEVNCCDPTLSPSFSTANCLDTNGSLTAISQLAAAGVKTIVVGIPGSAPYKSLLNAMAVAGGAPRDGDVRYYAADSLTELSTLIDQIGSQVLISCSISLDQKPEDSNLVNVYFDSTLVKSNAVDGWSWTGPTTIQLNGEACDTLLSGSVGAVSILLGCPTEIQ